MALINSIDDLRNYVKINRSKDFTTYKPFIEDATRKYLEPFFGKSLLTDLEDKGDEELRDLLCRALGPFSLALATAELSIQFGESGHTVSRSETSAPASDAKIALAQQSLKERGWANLDNALRHLFDNADNYPLFNQEQMRVSHASALFNDYLSFQHDGMVDIDLSPLTFHTLLSFIKRIERSETFMFLPDTLRDEPLPDSLKSLMQAYTASRVAAVHTAKITRAQRSQPRFNMEFTPLIRPVFDNPEDDTNFYSEQAQKFKQAIDQELIRLNLVDADATTLHWNEQDKKIFVSNAK